MLQKDSFRRYMLSYDKIKQFSVKSQTNELNIRREYFQHLFLQNLYQQRGASSIFFKGGTAIRLVYKSPRFSEDLDFSTSKITNKSAETFVENTLLEIERIGIDTNIKESKLTSGGYLAIIRCKAWESETGLKVEISIRDKNPSGRVLLLSNDYIQAYPISVLSQDTIASEKITALLTRSKPRDFYDLYFLLRANLLTVEDKTRLTDIYKLIESTRIDFDSELKLFLPKDHWKVIGTFKDNLLKELSRYI